ncbi:hypothetical protein PTI45_04488 [Paenibacillus nuruki]|uniref:SMODS and SLOG-associating 2TM effector domain-containing protein n=1 Tax=Paenibacillus nuruki TaxID=1886670 RepID=A0A1E3KXF1_9BACL|nr:hypothetical protein [Paenibacillus nuruki]ODP26166.1 hypothetical protein PTI45_04488 [Paenibacillus nuruki]
MLDTLKSLIPYWPYITAILTLLTIITGYLGQRSHKRYEFFITKTEDNIKKWYPLIKQMNDVIKETDQRKKSNGFITVMELLQNKDSPIVTEFDSNVSLSYTHLQERYDRYKKEINQENLNQLWNAFKEFVVYTEESSKERQQTLYARHRWYNTIGSKDFSGKITIYVRKLMEQICRLLGLTSLTLIIVLVIFMPGIFIENKVKIEDVVSTFFILLLLAIISIGTEIALRAFNLPNKKLTYYATSETEFKKLKKQRTNVEYKIKQEENPQLYL